MEELKMMESAVASIGFTHYAPLKLENIVLEPSLRQSCECNTCGKFGKNHSCPPNIGTIEECMAKLNSYKDGFLFQYIGQLDDPYDFEGMMDAQNVFQAKVVELRKAIDKQYLVLGAGPCCLCENCTFDEGKPCRMPDIMLSSVEAHGVFVNPTLLNVGLKYNNGENTVSYVGIIMRKK